MSLFGALRNTVSTFDALSKAVEVTQNNIANASTPGYARQSLWLTARPFELGSLPGGVAAGALQTSRQDFAERNVRQQIEKQGSLAEAADRMANLEQVFDISGRTGIAADMSSLFASFSAWSLDPNDTGARRSVVSSLTSVAKTFNDTVATINAQGATAEQKTRSTVQSINHLVGVIREINVSRRALASSDPGTEAHLHNTLDELSALVNFTASFEQDGTVSLSFGGRYPLLLGDHQTEISVSTHQAVDATYPAAVPAIHVYAGDIDLTQMVQGGSLSALLEYRNETIPSLVGGPDTLGELNVLARSFAERVNQISTGGGGPALFTFDAANPVRVAHSLAVAPGVTAEALVAAGSTANDIPLALAGLAKSQDPLDKVAGMSYTAYFARIVSVIGEASAEKTRTADVQSDVVTQAKAFRSQISGVSLNEEAVNLIGFQRSYEAMARMTSVLNEMTETVLTILR